MINIKKPRISQLFFNAVFILSFFLFLLSPVFSHATIRVSTLRVDFQPNGNRYQDVFVQNMGNHIEYIDITLFKRTDPAHDINQIVFDEGDPKVFGLVATPSKMALNPNQIKRIRILNLTDGKNKTDLVYGLKVLPVPAPIERAPSAEDLNNAGQVSIIAAYIIGVYVLPANPAVNLNLKRSGKTLIITNTGNTNALLDQCIQAPTGRTQGSPLHLTTPAGSNAISCPDVRIYAQSAKTITLPEDAPVAYRANYLGNFHDLKSN